MLPRVASRALKLRAMRRVGGRGAARSLKLIVGSTSVPHREKKDGEDAYFASAASASLGVADGVGGSKREGVDPGAFSRRLLAYAQSHAAGGHGAAEAVAFARRSATGDDLCRRGGSSTLLVATLEGDRLEVCNYGDSALALLRPTPRRTRGEVGLWPRAVVRTVDQTHYFNCPFQASADDSGILGAAGEAEPLGSAGPDAVVARTRPGDLVLAATDGFWDNVRDHDAQKIIADRVAVLWAAAAKQRAFGPLSDQVATLSDDPAAGDECRDVLDDVAAALAAKAAEVFEDDEAVTPFSDAAKDDGLAYYGGKEDDIAVVLALVADDATTLSALDEALVHNFRDAGLPVADLATSPTP